MSGDRLLVNVARLRETSAHIQATVGSLQAQLAYLESDAGPVGGHLVRHGPRILRAATEHVAGGH
jgi:hypothetical protein